MPQDSKPPRRSKDRAEGAPVPTDLVERMVQLQRRNATFSTTRTRERTERTLPPISTTIAPRSPPAPSEPPRRPLPAPQHPLPHVVLPSSDPVNADDFSRRLNISSSPRSRPAKAQGKLFNPNTDPIPMRRTQEPEPMSDDTGSSYARGSSKLGPSTTTQRQLYDHKRDDPARFANGLKPAPTPKSSGDYLSSASSHAPSFTSSSFTLSSSTDGSSDPSSIFDGSRPRNEPKPNNALSTKLKRTYRDITELEAKILREEPDDSAEDGRILLRAAPDAAKEDPEGARWQRMVRDHKELAELMSWLLEESTAPIHPVSMCSIPVKYNIVARLWCHAFNRLLEKLRVAAQASKLALEHLQSFINYAYIYYTILYEHPFLDSFKSHWLESLGSLARYRLAVLALSPEPVAPLPFLSVSSYGGTTPYPLLTPTSTMGNASESSGRLIERVDDSPSPSVGIVAARNFDLEPDKEHWRAVARQWYGIGLLERPGEGRLHQYLGQLSRDVEGEDLRTIYHFSKSLIATHPSAFSREHVIQSWSPAAQARRAQPDSSASDLFVLIHGMLFTNIQLDDFKPSLARLLERLAIEAPESRDWSMMAALNIGALLEYGRPKGILRSASLVLATDRLVSPAPKVKSARKEQEADSMDVDKEALAQRTSNGGEHSSPTLSEPSASEATPPAFTMAVELTFTMLSHALDSVTSHAGVTSYITIILTFLATVFKTPDVAAQLERAMPWSKLARVLSKAPSRALQSSQSAGEKLPTRAALPEDWCVRGMAWTGRQLFERGFWKTDEPDDALPLSGSMTVSREMEVLDERGPPRGSDGDDGMLVDEDDGDCVEDTDLRWQRVAWAGARFSRLVDGFTWRGDRAWSIEGPLAAKVAMWAQEERLAKEEEEQRLRGTRWSVDDTMELDADGMDNPGESSSQSEDDDEDSEEVRELKASKLALEHLQSFINYAYTYYTILYEHPFLDSFKSHWLESLGSLARYRLAVLALSPEPVAPPPFLSVSSYGGTTPYPLLTPTSTMGNASESSGRLIERVDDSPSPSVGIVAARNFDLEPDKEHWRAVARQWYGIGLLERPGEGRLHQYLGQLSRDVEGEDLRTIYHFSKSLIATHPSAFSREHVIQSWSPAAQARRAQPDSSASDLFVLIHGMLFTNIQLDDFKPSLARLLERLAIEAPESRDWSMMAALNIGALLEYGRPKGILRSASLVLATDRLVSPAPKVKSARKEQEADSMDVDKEALAQRTSNGGEHSSPTLSEPSASEATPPAFTMAVELTFTMLSHALDSVTSHAGVTSYITIILTFLATVFKTPDVAAQLERAMPWSKLARVLSKAPSRALQSSQSAGEKLPTRAALPEDWCVRGMAWTGRQLFERGFWKTDEPDDALPLSGSMTVSREMEVLDERGPPRGSDGDDGMLVDEDDGDCVEDTDLRWQRVAWAGARFSRLVDGFTWRGNRAWSIEGPLAAKVAMWAQEERLAKEEEEQRLRGTRWSVDDTMELDADGMDNPGESSSQSEDDDEDSEEVRELKARRRYLRNLLQPVQRSATPPTSSAPPTQRRKRPHAAPKGPVRPSLKLVPGFSVLVMDTNILLSSLAMVTALVESGRWTVVVPLPVIMELDGLGTNATALGEAAKSAVAFLVSHVRSHSTSLKVQTSRGNYLSSLNVRSEVVDFSGEGEGAWERNMDDLILRAAVWQDEHWVDRSAILGGDGERGRERDTKGAAKVVLLSLDRNLRLKARARQLDAASETDLAFLLAAASAA
ncbi:hypothetical protein OF83DRAFT_1169880 [Amylostereum chailletii]|nr:hypothetical protein OF83DRAFT_1169880 [Amylostereum chailletii]